MRRARPSLFFALALSCAAPAPISPSPPAAVRPALPFVTPSRIVPAALSASHLIGTPPDGSRRYLVSGIRILERPDGSREQAKIRLPEGLYRALDLPSRLGGGVLFVASAGGTTLIYRAESWLGEPSPLARIQEASREIVAGFDRLYLRLARTDEWIALDPQSGDRVPLGSLPEGPKIGRMAFADAWRAVVVADLLGPLASFDAGASWQRVPIREPVTAVVAQDGELVLMTGEARYRLDPQGELIREPSFHEGRSAKSKRSEASSIAHRPPERLFEAAIADGFPDSPETALLARGGKLSRVRLGDGAVVAENRRAYAAADGPCHSIALGEGAGFVCSASTGETSIYELGPELTMRKVARFSIPRVALASANGGLAIRGGCGRELRDVEEGVYCIRTRAGEERELRLSAPSGDERVVVLADGRVAVISPPSDEGERGELSIWGTGGKIDRSVLLEWSEKASSHKSAIWLEGFEEREPGILSGWLDAGSEVRGIRLDFYGEIEVASEAVDMSSTIVSGPFALAIGSGSHRARESRDGGFTFSDVDLPANLPRGRVEDRACSSVGCVVGGWMRIGWGEAEGETAISPEPSSISIDRARGLSLRCELTGQASDKLDLRGPSASPRSSVGSRARNGRVSLESSSWLPFRGTEPPRLSPGDIGFDSGSDPTNHRLLAPLRVYAWGPRASDWSRSGRVMARFEDRFRLDGVHETEGTLGIFSSAEKASELLHPLSGPLVSWSALLDPSGEAAVIFGCRSGRCSSFGAEGGGRFTPFQGIEIRNPRGVSVARLGESWFVMTAPERGGSEESELYRVDFGRARKVASFPRVTGPGEGPRLVRRRNSGELGILVLGPAELDRGTRDWFVLPLDPEGQLGPPLRLVGSHLSGDSPPPPCSHDDDGWLVDAQPSPSPMLRMSGRAGASAPSLTSNGVRLRLEGGRACVEALSAHAEGLASLPSLASGDHLDPRATLPLVATDSATGRRHLLRCAP